jgi:hypothetical protein
MSVISPRLGRRLRRATARMRRASEHDDRLRAGQGGHEAALAAVRSKSAALGKP